MTPRNLLSLPILSTSKLSKKLLLLANCCSFHSENQKGNEKEKEAGDERQPGKRENRDGRIMQGGRQIIKREVGKVMKEVVMIDGGIKRQVVEVKIEFC